MEQCEPCVQIKEKKRKKEIKKSQKGEKGHFLAPKKKFMGASVREEKRDREKLEKGFFASL